MRVFVKVKAIAGKKTMFDAVPFEVDDNITNSNDLVTCIVRKNVRAFNAKAVDQPLFTYLTNEELSKGEQIGKIGFMDKKNESQQDEEEAVDNALTCFNDGIFRLYIDDQEIGYNTLLTINENDQLVFIRLTMLAGRLW